MGGTGSAKYDLRRPTNSKQFWKTGPTSSPYDLQYDMAVELRDLWFGSLLCVHKAANATTETPWILGIAGGRYTKENGDPLESLVWVEGKDAVSPQYFLSEFVIER